jgi:hypothetical protein
MRADAGPQTFHFQEQFLAVEPFKVMIGVHATVSSTPNCQSMNSEWSPTSA